MVSEAENSNSTAQFLVGSLLAVSLDRGWQHGGSTRERERSHGDRKPEWWKSGWAYSSITTRAPELTQGPMRTTSVSSKGLHLSKT